MNCKPGDLAIFVRSSAGNEGKIVRCIKYLGRGRCLVASGEVVPGDLWEIDAQVPHLAGDVSNRAWDHNLRQIRDPGDDAQDETLQWLDVPSKETV